MTQKCLEYFRLLLEDLAWIEHQFLSDIRDSRKPGSLWGMMSGVGGVRKSIHQSWLAKGLGLGLLCWGFKGVQEEIPLEEASTLRIGSAVFPPGQCTSVIFWPSIRPKNTNPRWYTGRKWHIPMASNWKRSGGRIKAYDMGQGEGPIVPLTVMHRKRVTSELHDSYFRLMTIKHPIQRSSRRSCGRWVII